MQSVISPSQCSGVFHMSQMLRGRAIRIMRVVSTFLCPGFAVSPLYSSHIQAGGGMYATVTMPGRPNLFGNSMLSKLFFVRLWNVLYNTVDSTSYN